jgi:hypothetical protein
MKCRDVQDKLLFYLDHELNPETSQVTETHLANCSECRRKLELIDKTRKQLQQGFQEINRQTAPSWLWMELKQQLTAKNSGQSSGIRKIVTRARSLVLSKPRWRPVLIVTLILVLILSAFLFPPRLLGPSPEVMAKNIAEESPEVKALAGGQPVVESTRVAGTLVYVLSKGPSGESSLAYVDLKNQMITRIYRLPLPAFSSEDLARITDTAAADPTVRLLLDNGGTIDNIVPISALFGLDLIDGQPAIWTESVLAGVIIKTGNQTWMAKVDLIGNRVINFSPWRAPSSVISHLVPPNVREKLIGIAQADARADALFDSGAEVVDVANGQGKMAGKASVILKRNEETWSVRIDLETQTVSHIEPVPVATYSKVNLFKANP